MAPAVGAHNHRSTTKAPNKPFKSRHLTKGSLKELSKGKIESREKGRRRTPHQQVMSKLDRRNQARQKRNVKARDNAKAANVFSGQHGAPRITAVVPLCDGGDAAAAVRQLNASLDSKDGLPGKFSSGDLFQRTHVHRFNQNLQFVTVRRDLLLALDTCRVADFVIFILSPDQEVDELGERILRAIEGQGISTAFTVTQGLNAIDLPKRRAQIVSSLKSYITHFLPDQEKVFSLDSKQECSNLVRSLCTATPQAIRWREDRSWMLIEDVHWHGLDADTKNQTGELTVTGVVRGKGLKADRLVHLGDWGDFQIAKITAAPLPEQKNNRPDKMTVDQAGLDELLELPTEDQDDLAELAPEKIVMQDLNDVPVPEANAERKGVLLDDHHYFSDDESHIPAPPKSLPKGTSSYQAAWFLDNASDSASEDEDAVDLDGDLAMNAPALSQDGVEGLDRRQRPEPTETAPSEAMNSEMFLDPTPDEEAEQLASFRSRKKDEAQEDREFPDEIELHPNVLARERLARYRGLKSVRTSVWAPDEDKAHEPAEWRRLLQVADYKSTKNQVTREALVGGVQPRKRVNIHLRHVPLALRASKLTPVALFSLLRHEHKQTVVNYSISLNSDHPVPIKSKDELLLQCGPHRLIINPLFSLGGQTPNNVHKFSRYLHPGQTAVATFIAPLIWGSVPALVFKRASANAEPDSMETATTISPLELIGTGTSLAPDHNRVVAKRVILTGHPYKIHKKLVTVRYMFFNREDVNWFKALQLWTKRGRSGYIKESLGTHGHFKATFDAKINPQDAVGVSLYKRVFPRTARAWVESP